MATFQTRSERSGVKTWGTMAEALKESRLDKEVWKISFDVGQERIRLVRESEDWVYEDISGNRN